MVEEKAFFLRESAAVNLDITNKCALQCPLCQRHSNYLKHGNPVPGHDMTLQEFKKVSSYFKHINFCGQYSDPIHHPQFLDFLKICAEKDIGTCVHVASTARPENWFFEAFKANPHAYWMFGIDGLPHESHLYRKNQNGEKLFKIMIKSKKYLKRKPCWQYIIFKYNENHVGQAKKIAKENDLVFLITHTIRAEESNELFTEHRGASV